MIRKTEGRGDASLVALAAVAFEDRAHFTYGGVILRDAAKLLVGLQSQVALSCAHLAIAEKAQCGRRRTDGDKRGELVDAFGWAALA